MSVDATPPAPPDRPTPIIVALGGAVRDASHVAAINDDPGLVVASQPGAADALLALAAARDGDAALVADDLRGLDPPALARLASWLPVVVLAAEPWAERWAGLRGAVLPAAATPDAAIAALRAALADPDRALPAPPLALAATAAPAEPAAEPSAARTGARGRVVAVIGPPRTAGTGGTLVAANLAAALSQLGPTALIDLDLDRPALAGALAIPSAPNLVTAANSPRATPAEWALTLGRELTSFGPRLPRLVTLAGLPHDAGLAAVTPAFVAALIDALAACHAAVVLDVGRDLGPPAPAAPTMPSLGAVHRRALLAADRVLLVGRANRRGARRLREAWRALTEELGLAPATVEVVVNDFDRALRVGRAEAARAIGAPVAAWLPHDRRAVELADRAGAPLGVVAGARGPAYRAITAYAEALAVREGMLPAPGRWRRLIARLLRRRATATPAGSAAPPPDAAAAADERAAATETPATLSEAHDD